MFRSFMGAALIALALCSCSTIKTAYSVATGTNITQKQVAVAVNAFNAVEVTATQYLKLPTCTATQTSLDGCKVASVVPIVIKDVKAGIAARDSLWAASKAAPNGVGISALYSAVVAATSALSSDLAK